MKKHANIPIFIPHYGCPNDCVFCNQRKISGRASFEKEKVEAELSAAFATLGERKAQIAFFGGSFTGIPREEMLSLLAIANRYIEKGQCESIRISTRPDYINQEILDILEAYHVRTIELGVQSMDDRVLLASRRGHTAKDTERAFSLIRERGFELIGQMMTGLPLSSGESEIMTAERICEMGAEGARIYPTVVFRDTALHEMAVRGEYTPFTTEEAVRRTADVLDVFLRHALPVIRIGLQASEVLTDGDFVSGGGYHPAMGEMVYSLCMRRHVEAALEGEKTRGKLLQLAVNPSDVSLFAGHGGMNKTYLIEHYGLRGVKISSNGAVSKYRFTWKLTDTIF